MAENKLTDKEIIKALECCKGGLCCGCPRLSNSRLTGACMRELINNALDLINRQQAELEDARIGVKSYKGKYESAVKTAKELKIVITEKQAEIERLTINMNAFGLGMKQEKERADTIRAEAIKEYKNKVENDIVTLLGKSNYFDVFGCLNYRYKEMVGEK